MTIMIMKCRSDRNHACQIRTRPYCFQWTKVSLIVPTSSLRKLNPAEEHSFALILFEQYFQAFKQLSSMSTQKISPQKQQDLQTQYQNYKNTLQSLAGKIGDVEQEQEEHKYAGFHFHYHHILTHSRLVLESLNTLPSDRKCFRMINGVLVERTVGDVLPTLKTNSEGLAKVLEELVGQYRGKQDEMEKWKVSFRCARWFLKRTSNG
jgi:prefoldin subunit 2